MIETRHTPAPWGRNIKPASRYPIVYAGRNTHVARVITQGLSETETEANCDLIAAAPDLLDALLALHHHCREVDSSYRNGLKNTDVLYDAVATAIAKALGE